MFTFLVGFRENVNRAEKGETFMGKTCNISYDLIIENEKRVLRYAARTSDCFSVVTEQIKPFSARPAKCRHDAVLEPISDCLVKQTVGVNSWLGTMRSGNHWVLNLYRITKATKNWLNEAPNLFLYRDDMPEDICFYRNGKAWLYATTHEKMIHIIDPTDADLAFFKGIEDEA